MTVWNQNRVEGVYSIGVSGFDGYWYEFDRKAKKTWVDNDYDKEEEEEDWEDDKGDWEDEEGD